MDNIGQTNKTVTETENIETTPQTSEEKEKPKRWSRKWLLVAAAITLAGITGITVFALKGDEKSANTTTNNGIKDKAEADDSLDEAEADEALPENNVTTGTETETDQPVAPQSTNNSTLTIKGVTTMTPTAYGQPGTQAYKRIDFTIHNNSSVERTYGSQYGANYIVKGVTSTNEIKDPLVIPGAVLWQSSTIAPGGTADGFILFQPNESIAKLEWKAPGNSDTLYYPVPSE